MDFGPKNTENLVAQIILRWNLQKGGVAISLNSVSYRTVLHLIADNYSILNYLKKISTFWDSWKMGHESGPDSD